MWRFFSLSFLEVGLVFDFNEIQKTSSNLHAKLLTLMKSGKTEKVM